MLLCLLHPSLYYVTGTLHFLVFLSTGGQLESEPSCSGQDLQAIFAAPVLNWLRYQMEGLQDQWRATRQKILIIIIVWNLIPFSCTPMTSHTLSKAGSSLVDPETINLSFRDRCGFQATEGYDERLQPNKNSASLSYDYFVELLLLWFGKGHRLPRCFGYRR